MHKNCLKISVQANWWKLIFGCLFVDEGKTAHATRYLGARCDRQVSDKNRNKPTGSQGKEWTCAQEWDFRWHLGLISYESNRFLLPLLLALLQANYSPSNRRISASAYNSSNPIQKLLKAATDHASVLPLIAQWRNAKGIGFHWHSTCCRASTNCRLTSDYVSLKSANLISHISIFVQWPNIVNNNTWRIRSHPNAPITYRSSRETIGVMKLLFEGSECVTRCLFGMRWRVLKC